MQIRRLKILAGIVVLMLVAGGVAGATTKDFKGSDSGTAVATPVELDGDSCFTAPNGATVCAVDAVYGNVGGSISPGGTFTEQDVQEFDLVSGMPSCIIPGIKSCTLAGSSEQGCELQGVPGGTAVERDNSSGDLLFLAYSSDTLCLDLSGAGPFNFAGSGNATITGGTGKNAGVTGVETFTYHGQQFSLDPAGNGLSWVESSFTGTITTP